MCRFDYISITCLPNRFLNTQQQYSTSKRRSFLKSMLLNEKDIYFEFFYSPKENTIFWISNRLFYFMCRRNKLPCSLRKKMSLYSFQNVETSLTFIQKIDVHSGLTQLCNKSGTRGSMGSKRIAAAQHFFSSTKFSRDILSRV